MNGDDLKKAQDFLTSTSEGKTFMDGIDNPSKQLFTDTKKNKDNHSYKPNIQDALEHDFAIIPAIRPIVKTTTKVLPTVFNAGKNTLNKVDDIYLNTGIKSDNFMNTVVKPKVDSIISTVKSKSSDVYYSGKNEFLANPTRYMQGGADAVESLPLGIPPLSKIGYGVGGYGLVTDFLDKNVSK